MRFAIVMTAYQRPEYLEQTLKSWNRVRGLDYAAQLRVCLEPSEVTAEMAGLAASYFWDVHVNSGRLGVLVNPVESVGAVFRERPDVDFVILAEEDVVVSSDVLEYFNWAQQFRADPSVGVVCAHRPASTTVDSPRPDAVLRLRGFSCPLVWGTWADRWFGLIEPTWDRDYRANGWDWNLVRVLKMAAKDSIIPEQNRSDHIGAEGGAHCTPAMFSETQAADFREDMPRCAYRMVEGPA